MIYYLEDSATKSIIVASENIFLVNNISSGILDNYLRITYDYNLISQIKDNPSTDVGMAIVSNSLVPVDLSNFEYTKEKLRLVKLRKPLFEYLLANVHMKIASNMMGFSFGDEVFIQYALNDNKAIAEYASVLNMSPEFAKKELSLISDSAIKNNFRIFTVASQFKTKINNVQTADDAKVVKSLLDKAFNVAGMVNV